MNVQEKIGNKNKFVELSRSANQAQGLDKIINLAWGFSQTGALITALELEIFDRIDEGYNTPDEIAKAANCSVVPIQLLLDALGGLELLDRTNNTYTLAQETATYLVQKNPAYIGHLWKVHKYMNWSLWSQLPEAVKSGNPQKNLFSFQQDKLWEIVIPYLNSLAYPVATSIVTLLKEKNINGNFSVLDLGCGSGVFGQIIAEHNPDSRIVGVDQENVLNLAKAQAEKLGVEHQIQYLNQDIFEVDFQEKFDVILLSNILHGFDSQTNLKLLENSRRSLKKGGLIIINEFILDEDLKAPRNFLPLFFSLQFFLVGQGQVYTIDEYCEWLKLSGFTQPEYHSVPGPTALLLAHKN